MKDELKILMITPEISPYAKTGGLADVSNALPKALSSIGHKPTLVMPFYGFIKNQGLKIEEFEKDTITVGKKKFQVVYRKTDFTPEIPLYLIYNSDLFNRSKLYGYPDDNLRFLFFNLAVIKMIKKLELKPDVIHCHDWHAGLIPNFLAKKYKEEKVYVKISTLYTIHNLPFQFQYDWWKIPKNKADQGRGLPNTASLDKVQYINFAKRAILNADIINTVSERYAKEILTPKYGQGLDKILRAKRKNVYGIINGIDYTVFNPAFDKDIHYNFDWNSLDKKKKNKLFLQKEVGLAQKADTPIIGLVHRLSEQKGFDLLLKLMNHLLKLNVQFVVVGSGEKEYIKSFRKLSRKFPDKIALVAPFTNRMESLVYAGSDMFLMPSRYEPCGISQMKSMRYGSIPIVHETGGLSDTITNFNPRTERGNGFVFSSYTKEALLVAIVRALETYNYRKSWEHLTWQAMRMSYSWEIPAKKYVSLYRLAIKKHKSKKRKKK